MTYCVGIKLNDGLLAMADTRINSSIGTSVSKKLTVMEGEKYSLFTMTSGLRSVRDKVMMYFEDHLQEDAPDRMDSLANLYGKMVKKVASEDKKDLKEAGYAFNMHSIIGGQGRADDRSRMFLVFPEGNWIEVLDDTPYAIIGNPVIGKSVLKQLMHPMLPWDKAFQLAYLSFDTTERNVSDVGYPLDFACYFNGSFCIREKQFLQNDLHHLSRFWGKGMEQVLWHLPDKGESKWME